MPGRPGWHDSYWNKLDKELQIIYVNFLEIKKKGKNKVEWIHPSIKETSILSVFLEYTGDLDSIQRLGFKVTWIEGEEEVS